ncbi:MAG: peptide-methionine (R)-S-oxide reductase [Planctomycetaceae bacterium]
MPDKVIKSDAEWREMLTEEQFYVTRKKGTERAFTGEYHDSKQEGVYTCVCCGLALFDSDTKYDSGERWPSFWQPIKPENVVRKSTTG